MKNFILLGVGKFWKVEPSQAMLPPDIVKQVGRPKVKRDGESNEARKRIGQWNQSRKGTQMTYSNCGEPNHNARSCCNPKAAGDSSQSSARCNQTQESHAMDNDQESQTHVGPVVSTQEFTPYGLKVDNVKDAPFRPMIISETQSRIERGNLRGSTTGPRKIKFVGSSTPTNIPYSPTKLTWKRKEAISSSQVQLKARKRNIKMMATKSKRSCT